MPKSTSNPRQRIMHYCALAERCLYDVRKKLREWNVATTDIEDILRMLQDEGYVNNSRYAQAFASDQWRFQQWGKLKIRHALFGKQIEPGDIEKALQEIPEESYLEMLHRALDRKWEDLGRMKGVNAGQKILSFARQRGYEDDLVFPWLEREGLLEA